MNPIERVVRHIDAWQQRTPGVNFVFGLFKKFGDDRGSSLAVMLAYYGFMALFPLLLVLTTILGFVGNRRLENSVVGTTLSQFPVYGQQIGHNVTHPLTGSIIGLTLGLVGLLYGSLGAAQAGQHAMAQIWNVRGAVRPGFFQRLGRSLLFFLAVGGAMVAGAALSGAVTASGHGAGWRLAAVVTEAVLNIGLYLVVFRLLTPRHIPVQDLCIGAIVGGVGYSILLTLGTGLVQHQLRHAQAVYGQYAFVLGLMSWLYLVATLTLYAAEANVVLVRHLWPRSIVQPPLTNADQRVLADLARQEERRPEERIQVNFEVPTTP